MRIQHNIMAMNAYRNYSNNTSALSKNLEKLSSGYKINRAGDDAAGLAISEKMRAQITGLETAQKNAKDGISLVQTAEGALTEVHDMLNRMAELADQSANGTYDDQTDRDNLQKEFTELTKEIDRIADSSNFNGINLLDGSMESGATVDLGSKISGTIGGKAITAGTTINLKSGWAKGDSVTINGKTYTYVTQNASATVGTFTGFDSLKKAVSALDKDVTIGGTSAKATFTKTGESLTLQIGDTSDKYNQLDVDIKDMHAKKLGLDKIKISDQKSAQDAVDVIKKAINDVSSVRGTLGATQNRLDHTINNLSVMTENIQDAESTIRDTDVADEMMAYTKNNILVQSAQAMLAQANQVPQGVLQLLQ
ncbi:flagellin N-terminal helical domain-containing protein [Lawsonibacter sp. LCP25S3_G6]|uniref:flagellin N-terminal helical domain-containing protein n=1 Tax=unclassified Lawsonibacter TaxID=2617946 RepID=UPI003F9EB664